jgi:hypothetical protein
LLAVAAALLCAPPAHAAFEPGDDVTYSAGGVVRTGVVMVKAGAKDVYLVSRDGSESTQYTLPGSRLTLSPKPQCRDFADNDGDGQTDYPADPGCTGLQDTTESPDPDTTPPDTAVTAGPSGTTQATDASFQFTSSEANSSFECRLDGLAWEVCASPKGHTGLAVGQHTFEVRARDTAGNLDPTPATYVWTVEAPPPPPSGCPDGEYEARYHAMGTVPGPPPPPASGDPVLTRCEVDVDNAWGSGSPPGLPANGFWATWEGQIRFDAARYRFTAGADDGIRLYIDGTRVIDAWVNQAFTTYTHEQDVTAGLHTIKVEFYEWTGAARADLDLETVTTSPPPPVTQCNDGVDNADPEDTLADLADPGCTDPADNDETDPAPPPPPPTGEVSLQQIDGGPSYFGRFTNAQGWDDPSHFMVTSWCRPVHDQAQVDKYLDFGLNTIICLENPELTNEGLLRQNGLKGIVQAGERARFDDIGSETLGWHGVDELDMSDGGEFKCENGTLDQEVRSLNIPADGRLLHNNWGKGVGTWSERRFGGWTDARAACYVNYQQDKGLTSIDTYWLTDANEGWAGRKGALYGNDIDRLRYLDAFDGKRHPQFLWVELGPPGFGETFAPQPAEVRSAVWHAIIAGARGIGYFDHNFGTDGGVQCWSTILNGCYPQIHAMAKAVNQQIRELAPVLNSPFVTGGHSLSGAQTRRMVKWHDGRFYVFLATHDGGDATFSMPCVGDATAIRLAPSNRPGEAASIAVTDGSFTDSFADKNAVHIYRIDGGSSCGLN